MPRFSEYSNRFFDAFGRSVERNFLPAAAVSSISAVVLFISEPRNIRANAGLALGLTCTMMAAITVFGAVQDGYMHASQRYRRGG